MVSPMAAFRLCCYVSCFWGVKVQPRQVTSRPARPPRTATQDVSRRAKSVLPPAGCRDDPWQQQPHKQAVRSLCLRQLRGLGSNGQPANSQKGVTNGPLCLPRLESPTRSLLMEAPKGVQILAEAGDIQAICRNELRLESKDGEVGAGRQRSPPRPAPRQTTFLFGLLPSSSPVKTSPTSNRSQESDGWLPALHPLTETLNQTFNNFSGILFVFPVLSSLSPLFSALFLSLALLISLLPPLIPPSSHTPLLKSSLLTLGCSNGGIPPPRLLPSRRIASVRISARLEGKESLSRCPDKRRRSQGKVPLGSQALPTPAFLPLVYWKIRPLKRRWSICVITIVFSRSISAANVRLLNLLSHTRTNDLVSNPAGATAAITAVVAVRCPPTLCGLS